VLSIEEAVEQKSFFDSRIGPPAMTTDHSILSGDVAKARAAVVANGATAAAAASAAASSAGNDSSSNGGSNDSSSNGNKKDIDDDDLVVVSGEMRVGGQEHFYLEPNVTLCVPTDGGSELCVYSSTQNPVKTQNFVSAVCGLPANKV
jgi:xanthine dehydrogenase molybdopterin-binding subunit B